MILRLWKNISIQGVGKIILPVFMLLFFLFIPATALGVEGQLQIEVQVEGGALNLRSGPATTHSVLTRISAGTIVEPLFHSDGWLLVRHDDGSTGWVASRYTSFTSSQGERLNLAPSTEVVVQTNYLNVRSGPGTGYEHLEQVKLDQKLPVYLQQDNWLMIGLSDGSTGWVSGRYVKTLPEPEGTTMIEIQEPGTDEGTLNRQVSVAASSLRLRGGPGLEHEIITSLPRNSTLIVQGEQEKWLKVSLPDGQEGWVARWHTQPMDDEKKEANEPDEQPPRLVTVNTPVLRVRSGPGIDFSQVGRVFSGNNLIVLDEEKGWKYVQLPDNNFGWVSSDYTTFNKINGKDKDNITIVIDPGHGGRDRGATGVTGLLEKDVVLGISLEAAEQLEKRGYKVMMTRDRDVEISLEDRVMIGEKANADLFVSIHANAHPNPLIRGTEAFYTPRKSTSTHSFYIASLLQNKVAQALQIPSLGTKTANFFVIREPSMPAALLELGFLTNTSDEAILRDSGAQQQAADAIVQAIELGMGTF